MKRAVGLYGCLIVVSVMQAAYYYPKLPDTIALHFDGSGVPDGFQSKEFVLALDVGLVVFLVAVFGGINLAITRAPAYLMKLPNKDYWLAPQRRAQTHLAMSSLMLWVGFVTIVLALAVFQLAIHASLSESGMLNNDVFAVLLAAYAAFIFAWLIRVFLKFKRVPQ